MTAVATHPARPAAGAAGARPSGPAGSRPRQRTPRTPAPRRSLRELATGFAALYLEVESGRRKPAQAAKVMDPKLYAQLEQIWIRPGDPGRVVNVIGHLVSRDAYEAVAVVRRGARFGSLALRLVRKGPGWVVVDASRPEDGPLPDPVVPVPLDEHDAFDLAGSPDASCAPAGEATLVSLA
jgi:hypothetical protein